jgi:hypothetical protein
MPPFRTLFWIPFGAAFVACAFYVLGFHDWCTPFVEFGESAPFVAAETAALQRGLLDARKDEHASFAAPRVIGIRGSTATVAFAVPLSETDLMYAERWTLVYNNAHGHPCTDGEKCARCVHFIAEWPGGRADQTFPIVDL